ncbi:hypothetical protein H4R21_006616, partial [Coemansia helicoidea]
RSAGERRHQRQRRPDRRGQQPGHWPARHLARPPRHRRRPGLHHPVRGSVPPGHRPPPAI